MSGGRNRAKVRVDSPPVGNLDGGPVRTCVGCRRRDTQTEMLRVVLIADELVPDPKGRLPGRGAHLHRGLGCLDLAERRRAFNRALKAPGELDLSALRGYLAS